MFNMSADLFVKWHIASFCVRETVSNILADFNSSLLIFIVIIKIIIYFLSKRNISDKM